MNEPNEQAEPETPLEKAAEPKGAEGAEGAAAEPSSGADADSGQGKRLDLSRSELARADTKEKDAGEPGAPEPSAEPTNEASEAAAADPEEARRTVEALLFASEAPLAPREIGRASGIKTATVRKLLKAITAAYDEEARPWALEELASGWRLVTRPEYFSSIQKLKTHRSQRKLTPAALETLAVIAYSDEPVGRAQIEAVRGVDAGALLRQLLERKLIKIAGRGEGLGKPLLYAVSSEFLEQFGLRSAKDLPKPGELKNA